MENYKYQVGEVVYIFKRESYVPGHGIVVKTYTDGSIDVYWDGSNKGPAKYILEMVRELIRPDFMKYRVLKPGVYIKDSLTRQKGTVISNDDTSVEVRWSETSATKEFFKLYRDRLEVTEEEERPKPSFCVSRGLTTWIFPGEKEKEVVAILDNLMEALG